MAQSKELLPPSGKLPAAAEEFEDEGLGKEGTLPEERKTPFMYLLQDGSKATKRGMVDTYVDGAEAGTFFSVASRRVYQSPMDFIPVFKRVVYNEWVPLEPTRDEREMLAAAEISTDGVGFRKSWAATDPYILDLKQRNDRFKPLPTERGTRIIQTMEVWMFVGPPGFTVENFEWVIFPFTSIKIKKYTAWWEAADRIRYARPDGGRPIEPPIFKHRWRMSSVFEPQWKPGGAWNVKIDITDQRALASPAVNPNDAMVLNADPLYQAAKDLHTLASGGGVSANYAHSEEGARSSDDPDPPF